MYADEAMLSRRAAANFGGGSTQWWAHASHYTQLVLKWRVFRSESRFVGRKNKRLLSMRVRIFRLAYGVMLAFGIASPVAAQSPAAGQPPSAGQQLQRIHTPQSIDQESARLTKDLELTREQQRQIKHLLEEHHDKIQALFEKNPRASRQALSPQIHAISDETHREIHALLTLRQRKLESEMQEREHNGEENRRPMPPAANSPEPSSSAH
jgi:hypothetical protein